MEKLLFYEIDENYINFLSQFSEHLFKNAKITQKHSRKYIGILFEINEMKYFAPLSSFKLKHSQRCNDFRLLEEKCREFKSK